MKLDLMLSATLGVALSCLTTAAMAAAPDLQTKGPVIYLADNLDEKDNLGWCIDTLGRGFGDRLQTHSCKPQGGDVQFQFEADSGLIRSVAFPDHCMIHAPDGTTDFGLVTCDAKQGTQRFDYDATSGQITPTSDAVSCVVAGEASKSAGPFMSRTLTLAPCMDTDDRLKRWVVVD